MQMESTYTLDGDEVWLDEREMVVLHDEANDTRVIDTGREG